MHEFLEKIVGYIRSVWRHRWSMVLVAWFICIAGWMYVYTMPDQFQASARVYVDAQSILRPLLRGLAVETSIEREVDVITRTLLSRPNLEKLARMTDMDLQATNAAEMEVLLDRLQNRIKLSAERGKKDLYTITYEDNDPKLAKKMVQSLLTIFVEGTLGENRKDSDAAQRFLEDQVAEYEAKLRDTENKLTEFKRQNVGLLPSDGGNYYSKMELTLGQLEEAKLLLQEASNRRDELEEQLEDVEAGSSYIGASSTQVKGNPATIARISNLEAQINELLLHYTEQHPDVIAARRLISDLQAQLEKETEMAAGEESMAGNDDTGTGQMATNPVYQQLKIALSEADANVASLKTRVKEYQGRLDKLRRMINTVPEVEAEMTRLTRDYNVYRENYQKLMARLESARLSDEAKQTGDGVTFRVIDPPRVPLEPSGPNRPLYSSLVFVWALLAGIGYAFFISTVRPRYSDRRSIIEDTGWPVLGGVSMVWTSRQLFRRRLDILAFITILVMLFALYGAIYASQIFGITPPFLG